MNLLRWLAIDEEQCVHVVGCTALAGGMSGSWWGLAAFPFWYGVALLGKHTL